LYIQTVFKRGRKSGLEVQVTLNEGYWV